MPTRVRFHILVIATAVAFLMYLDRVCLGEIISSQSFKNAVHLSTDELKSWVNAVFFWLPQSWRDHIAALPPADFVKGAFFWAYALAQVPAGWLSDRFGTRVLVTVYIAAWSAFTLGTSCAWGFTSLMLMRLGCGLAEAGYYPASCGLLTRWAHVEWRGIASSCISMGGRIGGALAPWLTAIVIFYSGDWRFAGWSYGLIGIVVALGYWHFFREHPRQHPKCNDAEVALLAEGRGDFLPVKDPPRSFPLRAATTSINLWMMSLYQFLTNIGWAFLILSLPDYLKQVMHLDDKHSGTITSIALTIGILALPLGGYITDVCSRRFGNRMGRTLPIVVTRFLAAGCYLLALATDAPWLMALAFGGVAFFADLALPAVWAVMQDISGKHQAQMFGWANMWGNFGAAIQPICFAAILKSFDVNHDFHEGVHFCAAAFVIAGGVGFFINAEKPIVQEA